MHHVVFLANGKQTRFGPLHEPKQLLGIYGTPLILETMAKFQPFVDQMYVVTGNPVIRRAVGDVCVNVGPTDGLRATMLASRHLWGATRTTYLFGDCYYTPEAVTAIASCQLPYAHVARTHESQRTGKPYGESFAMTWTAHLNDRVADVLARNPAGTSWEFYRSMAGLDDLPDGENYLTHSPECLIRVDDFTDDFDSWTDYQRWFALFELEQRHEQERQALLKQFAA